MPHETDITPEAVPRPPLMAAWEQTALGELGKLSQQIVACVQEGIVVYDRDLRYTLWNPFMEKLTGQPAGEVLGKRGPDIHPHLKRHGVDVLLERALAGHPSSTFDFPYSQTRTGWSGWVSGRATPLRNAHGEIVGVISVLQDITKRKRAEEALVANELRYRQLFEDNPQPMFVYDLETMGFLAVNDAAMRHYGYTREEFLFMKFDDLLAPDDLPGALPNSGGHGNALYEARLWRHQTKDGSIIDIEITSHVIDFSSRRAVLVLADDVTLRRQAETALRESETKYRTLIETAEDAIFLADAESGKILEANRRAETLLGLPRHRIVGLHQVELHPPEQAAHYRDIFRRFVRDRAKPPRDLMVWHRAGRRIPVDIAASVVELGGRRLVQGIFRDITERKRAEEALARRTRQFEALSRANRQLIAALEVPAILRTLVTSALELVDGTTGTVGLVHEDKLLFTEYCAHGTWKPIDFKFASGHGVEGYVLATSLSYLCNEPLQDPLVVPEFQKALGFHNLIAAPILSHDGTLLGCVEIHNAAHQGQFEESDLTMLECLAASAAIAIGNARTLAARRQAEARYHRLARDVHDVIWSVDMDLRFADLTPSSKELFGYTPEELIGRSVFDLMTPASVETVKGLVGPGLKTHRLGQRSESWSRTIEVEHLRKDGATVWAEAKFRLLLDENKKPVGFVGTTRDITERRQARAHLERSLALAAATLESISDGILIVDTEGRMVGFNQTFVHMWRIPKAVVESRDDEKAVKFVTSQLKDPQGFQAKVKQLYATPDAESHDYIEFKDGRMFERFSKPQRVAGEVAGRVWSFRDVTGRFEAKAARAAKLKARKKPAP
ncbi:MAG: PAS domain S-box protein [Verrucomicrobia bacterium]|nr:PAS domain S-box protein [Verrucomicrobiota bacterium]